MTTKILNEINRLSEEGNERVDTDDFHGALLKFNEALALVPSPKEKHEASLWLYASIGDMYYMMDDFLNAKTHFFNALNCPDAQTNAFVHLRLGVVLYELNDEKNAIDHLLKAYMLEGKELFDNGDEEYFNFLESKVKLS